MLVARRGHWGKGAYRQEKLACRRPLSSDRVKGKEVKKQKKTCSDEPLELIFVEPRWEGGSSGKTEVEKKRGIKKDMLPGAGALASRTSISDGVCSASTRLACYRCQRCSHRATLRLGDR